MVRRLLIITLAGIAIIFSLFSLSVKVDANPGLRQINYRDVCCGVPCEYDFCFYTGTRECCIPEN
jgi:hypothetical protein